MIFFIRSVIMWDFFYKKCNSRFESHLKSHFWKKCDDVWKKVWITCDFLRSVISCVIITPIKVWLQDKITSPYNKSHLFQTHVSVRKCVKFCLVVIVSHSCPLNNGCKSRMGLNLFEGLILATRSTVFVAARIAYIHFFNAVHIYDLHVSPIRPFYGCVLSCQAFDLEWGWWWLCCDRDQYLVGVN